MTKFFRIFAVGSLAFSFIFLFPASANAAQVMSNVTCKKANEDTRNYQIGWDTTQPFFEGKGYIPRLFCEGGYAQGYNIYVSDDLEKIGRASCRERVSSPV